MQNITIVGVGLMGGSLAKALKGYKNANIIGIDNSKQTLNEAIDLKIINEGYSLNHYSVKKALEKTDICFVCIYPQATIDFFKEFGKYFKRQCIVTDICGIKQTIIDAAKMYLPKETIFIAGHPMAGREISGIEASISTLFNGCNYIFIKDEDTDQAALNELMDIAKYIGASRITFSNAKGHDKNIAYTSQIAHIIAASMVNHPQLMESKGFEGGSFRDLTRVATLNEKLWSELFLLNRDALSETLEDFIFQLNLFKSAIEKEDKPELERLMKNSTQNKERWKQWKN